MLGSIYAMIGVALTLSIGVLKFLNFSIPGLFMIGGMSTWVFIRHGMPWPLAGLCALAVGAAASLVVERFTWRWMRNAQEFVPLVSSMAFLILFENLAVAYWGSELQSVPQLFGSADWRIGGLVISIPQLLGLACSVVLIWGLSLLLSRTRLGRGLRTIAEDSNTALLLGVDINRIVPLGVRHQRAVRGARRRAVRPQLPAGASVHGRSAWPQGHLRHGGRRHGQYLGRHRRAASSSE